MSNSAAPVAAVARMAEVDGVATTTSRPKDRMAGIDGLRAVAALWVVLFHMAAFSGGPLWPGVDFIARSGSTGVSLFLVLSGLCLFLPYAGGRLGAFDTRTFFSRRIRRLLPAYYVTLMILVVVHALFGGRIGIPEYSRSELIEQTVTHLTLTHQFFPETFYGLNGAYWSLGLEWELYLTLPLLIVAAVKFGVFRVVGAVVLVTIAYRIGLFAVTQAGLLDADGAWATVVLPNLFLGRWSEFALGMLAAELYRRGRRSVDWRIVALAVLAAVTALTFPGNPVNHVLYGVVFFVLTSLVLAGNNPVARLFSWRPLVAIGVMSYSLYLVHQPLIEVFAAVFGAGQGTDSRTVFLLLTATVPLMILVALLLFVLVERRSLVKPGQEPVSVGRLLFPQGTTRLRWARTPAGARGDEPAPAASALAEAAAE